jgi:hypothetical protein
MMGSESSQGQIVREGDNGLTVRGSDMGNESEGQIVRGGDNA